MTEVIDFNQIYQEFQPKIHNYLSQWVGREEAEDLAQEVFTKVSRGLNNFKGKSKLSTWLYRIATNTALDRLKSASYKYSSHRTDLENAAATEDKNPWNGQPRPSTDQSLIREEMGTCVREYIDKLPPDYKAVIFLSEIEELKNREIAQILDISIDTVKIRLHRARAHLKNELDNGCDFYHNDQGTLACDRKPAITDLRKSPN